MASSTQFVTTLVALILFQLLIGNTHTKLFNFLVCLNSLTMNLSESRMTYGDSDKSSNDVKHAV